MRKTIIFLTAIATALTATAQYQLPNAGFEQWDGGNTSEPVHWNSFATSDGSYASLASLPHHYRRNGGRPGSTGSHFLTIYTQSIIGVKANGNMTTGRIHAGSMSASSSENYNYTQRSNADHCLPFTGTPDSMYVWVSFYASSGNSQAQVSAILHGDNDFRAPNQENDASLYCAKAVARFNRTTTSSSNYQWQQMKVPFDYSGNAPARYMLVNMTTNATPGGGDGNDSLSIDDIVLVYSAWLAELSIDGHPLEGFNKGTLDYVLHVDDSALLTDAHIETATEVDDASIAIEQHRTDDTSALVAVTVTAEDGVTVHTYTLTLTTGRPAVGISTPASTTRLSVYPNPATDAVTIETSDGDGYEAILCDLDGHVLTRCHVHGTTRLDLGNLPAGVYLLRCGDAVRRIVKG